MFDFIRKYSLPIGLKKSIKKNNFKRENPGYSEAKKVLVYFTSEGNQKIAMVKGLQNKLERAGKTVKFLYLVLDDIDKPDVHLDTGMERLVPTDFTYFGNIQKPSVIKLLDEEFDYLIHADVEYNIYSDLILAKSKAKCRIGKYFKDHESLYEMMVEVPPEKKIPYLLEQIYHYTKAL